MQKTAIPSIEFSVENHIGVLTVNRPQVRNALNLEGMIDFAAAIEQAYADPDLHVLIVTGAGKTFISGGDLSDLHGYNTEDDARRMITSSISVESSFPSVRCINSRMTIAPMSSGRQLRVAPRLLFPTAVRTPATITASLMIFSSKKFQQH